MFPTPLATDPDPPALFRSLRLVNDGCLPGVGPAPGIGSRLRGFEDPADGCGIDLVPLRGVTEAEALIDDDDVSLLILLDEGCRGVMDPDFGVVVPDLGVVPPDDTLPVADDGDNSKGLPSAPNGIS